MHPSQLSLLSSCHHTSSSSPPHSPTGERQRKMAIAAGSERNTTSSFRLRSNLLQKLGIRDDKTASLQTNRRHSSRRLLDGALASKEPLKYESEEDDDEEENRQGSPPTSWTERLFFRPSSLEQRSDAEQASSGMETSLSSSSESVSNEKRLTFNEQVSVMPIPTRHEYSKRIQQRLWTDGGEIMNNAQRNAIEFAAEGWDWHSVVEDEYMYRDAISGELIHPVHMEDEEEEQQQPDT